MSECITWRDLTNHWFETYLIDTDTWTEAYSLGYREPNYPVPAIPLAVKYDYVGCVSIDDVTNPDDPIIVWMYDSWNKINC